MVKIENLKIYELKESIIACRNAMRINLPDYESLDEFEKSLNRGNKFMQNSFKFR